MSLHIIILAAGQGKRMHSKTPKVLHQLGGKPMLLRVIEAAQALNPEKIHVVIGHGGDHIRQALPELPVHWVEQAEQLGTGHAVMQALPYILSTSQVLILSADVPLIQTNTLQALLNHCNAESKQSSPLGLLLANVVEPAGLGRIIRNQNNQISAIIEEKDADESQRQINEIYSGICCVSAAALHRWLPKLSRANAQGEYYLTEIIGMAVAENLPIVSLHTLDPNEILGVNNRLQLQQLERLWQKQLTTKLLLAGVSLADANRVDIRGELHCGEDVFIDINTLFEGKVILGDGCSIAPNCILKNVTIGANSAILANTVLENCTIGEYCQIGPFARIRPGTQLQAHCKIGNFVEAKNALFGTGSKANHLSYLGDVTLGKQVNIGAGTITCNYDGANKHQTIIEDGVFVGSDTQLVAPVTIGENATIGAGSTIRKNVPAGELTLTESRQKTVYGWIRPKKQK
ncbi:bifunctional UDP-N-acetylglucosamine diphosphorylase/glucosamine-1-phosphate N-acetyltransferase GlmU [Legionella nagasakiensis]|uniref:bifunctional UDP-N-acetylglucosamine diphosphorylase/glucosamine-1-phosphate N-acetyltransferase GlmU n=1 Tax=Legionella nagasakiensis TaxID=535290 RepID=UPI001055CECE|nr:bifunctional UDP-N-acetylglucosamine diphosphorylase/glucosamine-1-phosphate N-acetyltransferase GlmU [Legionella nagasakiensis]